MRATDLDLGGLLELDPKGGVVRFAGRRALIMDAEALGLLRKELVDTLGVTSARALLTRFGYAHGWRTAESMKAEFTFDSEADLCRAGAMLHALQGLFVLELPERKRLPAKTDAACGDACAGGAIWKHSYEAEQHLLHMGQAKVPVCWSLCGFASGYLSNTRGREIYVLEEKCVGRGDAVCQPIARPVEEWGDRIREDLAYFKKETLDASLARVTKQLKATERKLLRRKRALALTDASDEVTGLMVRSEPMRKVVDLARRVARYDSTVLITGESGSGKERIAQLVHDESARASGPFVAVNCGAVTETLLESELFGHARGAFTGATTDRPGLFEAASGGTLFLDEVGEVPAPMQVKLLRALQQKEVRRVGENQSRKVDVRVLSATNRDLVQEVAAGRFRKDLYYRLKVVELTVPTLRARREDLLPLARVLLDEAAGRLGRRISGLSPRAGDQVLRYDWPGNVRELENAMERAAVLAEGERVELEDLPEEVRMAVPAPGAGGPIRPLEEVERDYTLAALAANDGNQARTAAQLGIGTATLYRKLRAWQTPTPTSDPASRAGSRGRRRALPRSRGSPRASAES